jgi:hypothetical protein
VKKKGDVAIQDWIDGQLLGRSCAVVLVGEQTANRKWIKYEIKKAWDTGKAVVGIRIHNLLNVNSQKGRFGPNPFDQFTIGTQSLASKVVLWDPPGPDSKAVYASINKNIGTLVDNAIAAR